MIAKLSVQNFAIIEKTELRFTNGFTAITGETGAGKSILLGALSLILGQRADRSAILDPEKKCVIEGVFHIQKERFEDFFIFQDLDFEKETIVRRELKASGKSRAFINDTPVTLDVLRDFSSQVVDLHQQHESLSLTTADFQREVVDLFAGITSQVHSFSNEFEVYKTEQLQLQKKKEEETKNRQEQDFLEFQYQELQKANLHAGELEEIEEELNAANNLEEIQTSVQSIDSLLNDDTGGVLTLLKQTLSQLRKLAGFNRRFQPLEERFNSSLLEIEDIEDEITSLQDEVEIDDERMSKLTARANLLNRLMQKHQAQDDSELIERYNEIEAQLSSFESIGEEIQQLKKSVENRYKKLSKEAAVITAARKDVGKPIEKEAKTLLQQVGMNNAEISVVVDKSDHLNQFGADTVRLLFTANAGQKPQQLKQVASGGELSRLMLAIKTLIAGKTILPTMIFDEIDTGISGEVAMKVGNLLQRLSEKHQIISITHLPQIAAKAEEHLKVYKEEVNGATRSQVKSLTSDERVTEIAEMLSGANPSKTTVQAARELLR